MLYKTPNLSFGKTAQPTSARARCCCRTETTCAAASSALAMPCAAAVKCRLKQDSPGPPCFTCHKCRSCQGCLHDLCICARPDKKKKIMNKYVTNLTRAIARRLGNGAHHDYTAVRYVCFIDASACRQEIMDISHFYALRLSGAWGPPQGDIHI